MSSSIKVYVIEVERLAQVMGSRNQALIDAVVADREDFLGTVDDIDEEAEMTCAEAVAGLINGQCDEGPGYLYGYALEAICAQVGLELPGMGPISRASEWIEEVDALLEGKGVPVKLYGLVSGGSPVTIPEPDDYPFIGKWPAMEIPAALAAFRSLDPRGLDAEMVETFAEMCGWLEAAAKKPGASIVGFMS